MGTWLGIGLASLIAVLDPEVVVVGGGASRAGEYLLEPTRAALKESLEGAGFRSLPPVVTAALGEDAGLVGAALAAAGIVDG
jgi:glucokinase